MHPRLQVSSNNHKFNVNSPLLIYVNDVCDGRIHDISVHNHLIRINYCSRIFQYDVFPLAEYSNSIFFRFMPLVRKYYKALGAIEKLNNKDNSKHLKHPDPKKEIIVSSINKSDQGFKELLAILKKTDISFMDIMQEIDTLEYSQTVPELNSNESLALLVSMFARPQLISDLIRESVETIIIKSNNKEIDRIVYAPEMHPINSISASVKFYVQERLSKYILIFSSLLAILSIILVILVNIKH